MSISGSTQTSAFAEARVDEMLGQGATLADVEKFIAHQPISEEYRSALWLRAWAEITHSGSRTQRRRNDAQPW